MSGNVFAGLTSPIKKEWIAPTLEAYFSDLEHIFPNHKGFTKNFFMVGSAGKKDYSGDIDLAIDALTFFEHASFNKSAIESWSINYIDFQARYENLKKRARTATNVQLKFKSFFFFMAQHINFNSKDSWIWVDTNKISAGNMFSLYPQINEEGRWVKPFRVQIDWMVGNEDWLRFSMTHAGGQAENIKGLHRTQLILAAFAYKGYVFNQTQGVKNKETQEVLAHTPKQAVDLLGKIYDFKITKEIMGDYSRLEKFFRGHMQLKDFEGVADTYLKILDYTKADIPENFEPHWIEHKDRLELTGRFLPDDSALQEFI